MARKNVFIVGLDDFNLEKLRRLPRGAECDFHAALHLDEIRGVDGFDVEALIARASERIERFDGKVDAVATYTDFPASSITPILAEKYGLPGPSLRSILTCEHKYWSRLQQHQASPENIPPFRVFDPFDDDAFEKIDLVPPYWIKPIKSFHSFLAFQINGPGQFADAMKQVREHIQYMGRPFHWLMTEYGMPSEFADMKETMIAESPLSGSMCTLEGYSHQGNVVGYGIVDSVREPDRSSFARYQYPSSLPLEVQHRMIDVARKVVSRIGLDQTGFNIEFFYDQTADSVYLLEINPRISRDHTDMFEKVHGASHLRVMLDLALGEKPATFEKRGQHSMAANFMLRVYEPGRVTRVPSEAEVARVKEQGLVSDLTLHVGEGQHLSELKDQDSYSFELANLFIGGRDQLDLLDNYARALDVLDFEIQPDPEKIMTRRPAWTIDWDGSGLPAALRDVPPGRYVLQQKS